jgi:hypothetical protein
MGNTLLTTAAQYESSNESAYYHLLVECFLFISFHQNQTTSKLISLLRNFDPSHFTNIRTESTPINQTYTQIASGLPRNTVEYILNRFRECADLSGKLAEMLGDYYFNQKLYEIAVRMYSRSSVSFQNVMTKIIQLESIEGRREALLSYINATLFNSHSPLDVRVSAAFGNEILNQIAILHPQKLSNVILGSHFVDFEANYVLNLLIEMALTVDKKEHKREVRKSLIVSETQEKKKPQKRERGRSFTQALAYLSSSTASQIENVNIDRTLDSSIFTVVKLSNTLDPGNLFLKV